MINIDELKFDEKGLIPAIIVDSVSKRVLTLAYMNRESLEISLEKQLTCFWSRSRQKLWLKGATSCQLRQGCAGGHRRAGRRGVPSRHLLLL